MLEEIINCFPDEKFFILDGFNDAIIGLDTNTMRLIYSVNGILKILMSEGMTDEEAVEYYDFNIGCLHIGDQTPVFCEDTFFPDEQHLNN